jgi:hypothetical protein
MTEAQRQHLTRIGQLPRIGQPGFHLVQDVLLAPLGKGMVQLVGDIEMVFDGVFAASCNEYELFDPRRLRFFYRILY